MKRNPRPRKYESAAARQAAYKARADVLEFRAEPKTAASLTSIAQELDISRSELLLSMVKFALTNHDWARFGLTHKTLPYYQGNPIMATKKASPAQLAARKKFAEMARSGAFKKAKRAADRDKNPVKVTRHKANPTQKITYKTATRIAKSVLKNLKSGGDSRFFDMNAQIDGYLAEVDQGWKLKVGTYIDGLGYQFVGDLAKEIRANAIEKYSTNANFRAAAKTAKSNPVDLMTIRNLTTIKKMRDFFGITTDGLTDNELKAMRNELIVLGYGDFIPGQLPPKVFYNAMNFATGKVKNNPMEGALLHLYGNKYGQVKQYGNGLYTATILQKVNTGIGEEMDYYDSKEFKTKAGAARWLANSGKKTTRTNPSKRTSSRSAVVPNPAAKKPQKVYRVSIMQDGLHTNWMGIANFFTFTDAEKYSRYLSKQHPNWAIKVHDTRVMK